MGKERNRKNLLRIWLQATRPFSFTASITPVVIGAAWAIHASSVNWLLFPLFLVCAVLIHAATNLISDYEDFRKGVDHAYTYGSSGVLVQGLLRPAQVKKAAYVLFAAASILMFIIVAHRGVAILLFGLAGMAGGYFYTVAPLGYKYRALGEICVFIFMGVMLVVGAYWAMSGAVSFASVLVSLPISCLVAAILSANNVRDITHDLEAGVLTVAGRVGFGKAKAIYYALVLAAYVVVIGLVLGAVVTPWALVTFLSFPKAIGNLKKMRLSRKGAPETIATLDVETAQLHLVFGILFAVAIVLMGGDRG